MRRKVIAIILMLYIMLCLNGCKAEPWNYDLNSATEQLVKEWNPDKFRTISSMDESSLDSFIELVAAVIDRQDIASLKNLFAPNIWERENVADQAEVLFKFIDGTITKIEMAGRHQSYEKEADFRKSEIDISCNIETTMSNYRIAMKLCVIDSGDMNNVGIYSLHIIDADLTDMNFTYWVGDQWIPGISIDTTPLDI